MINNALLKTCNNFWIWWRGEPEKFSLESRIFHSFSMIVFAAISIIIPINIYVGLYYSALLAFSIFITQGIFYYLSRFKHLLDLAILLSALNVNIILGINYFLNGGISGPSLLLLAVTLFLILAVSKLKNLFIWLIFNLVNVIFITGLEYLYGKKVINSYPDRDSLFIDNILTYIVCIVLLYAGTTYLKTSYLKQKKAVSEKADALGISNNEKDKIFSIISHDLRTPLANVQQYLEMIAVVDLTDEERKAIEKDLLEMTKNSQELLTNLLHWSRNQMDNNQLDLQVLSLNDELQQTLKLMQIIAGKKNISIDFEVDKNIRLKADREMLKLIFRNLLHNAIKFSHPEGKISIQAVSKNNNCLISITDSGKGINKEVEKEIFTLKTKTTFGTQKEKGTGIGLMLCKEYTEMQNGKIWFTSEENKGTTFFLSFLGA